MKDFTEIIVLMLHFIVYLSWLVIGLMGDLLSNDIVMDPRIVPLMQMLWTLVRNLVNMTFVAVLLYIAFKTIFNVGNDGMSEIKENLQPMILAMVLVNFSFLGMKVLIDASSVATNAAFSLSNIFKEGTVFKGCTKNDGDNELTCDISEIYAIHFKVNTTAKNDASYKKKNCSDPVRSANDEFCNNSNKNASFSNMIFVLPYNKIMINGGKMSIAMALNDDVEELAKMNFSKKFQKETDSGEPVSYDINKAEAVCFYHESNKKDGKDATSTHGSRASTAQKCMLKDYLQEQYDQSMIVLVKKPYLVDSLISNRTIVPMISTNLLSLESLLFRTDNEQNWAALILNILFSFTMAIALLISFIAMFIVLVVRVAVLWIAFILSPLVVFVFFDFFGFKAKLQEALGQVIAHAFVPALLGLVLSVTFILVGQLHYQTAAFSGSLVGETVVLGSSVLGSTSPIFSFFLQILIIVFMWVGVFSALKMSTITNGIISTIDTKVRDIARKVATAPLYMNFMPMSSGGKHGKVGFDNYMKHFDNIVDKYTGGNRGYEEEAQNLLSGKYDIKSDAGKAAENNISKLKIEEDKIKVGDNNTTINLGNLKLQMENNSFRNSKELTQLGEALAGKEKWKNISVEEKKSILEKGLQEIASKKGIKLGNAAGRWDDYSSITGTSSSNINMKKIFKGNETLSALKNVTLFNDKSEKQIAKALDIAVKNHGEKFQDIAAFEAWYITLKNEIPTASVIKKIETV